MAKDVIVALDFARAEETLAFLDGFRDEKPYVKIGMELFYGEGPKIVREIKARGHKIFLDLKLHDIPNTVGKAMAVLSGLDIDMVNLHAAGGIEMMKAALKGADARGWQQAASDRRYAAYFDDRRGNAKRAFDRKAAGRGGHGLRRKRGRGRT